MGFKRKHTRFGVGFVFYFVFHRKKTIAFIIFPKKKTRDKYVRMRRPRTESFVVFESDGESFDFEKRFSTNTINIVQILYTCLSFRFELLKIDSKTMRIRRVTHVSIVKTVHGQNEKYF